MEIIATALGALVLMGLILAIAKGRFIPPEKEGVGDYVAEVWLEWEISSGSTLYRQRFPDTKSAERAVRRAAKELDAILPTHYRVDSYNGRPQWEKHGFQIQFGVRDIQAQEKENFNVIWSPYMPGERKYTGEHAAAHPMLQGSLAGFKV